MHSRLLKKTGGVLLLIVAFGLMRLPFEDRLQARLEAEDLLPTPLGISMLDQMGQSAFVATLGGARSLVAVYMTLLAYDGWQNQDWAQVEKNYGVIHRLQPYDLQAWILGAWHQHTNGAINMLERDDWRAFKLPQELDRQAVSKRYIDKGIEMLRDGIRNNPESGKLYQELAWTLWKKAGDPCAAADAYERAMNLPGSFKFTERFRGYAMADCPEREGEAYDYLLGLYREGDRHHTASVIITLKELEAKLDVPFMLRILDEDPDDVMRRNLEMNARDSGLPWLP